jgi:hypothetical protein
MSYSAASYPPAARSGAERIFPHLLGKEPREAASLESRKFTRIDAGITKRLEARQVDVLRHETVL